MDDAFGTVLIVVSLLAVLVAAISYWGSGRIYSGLGRSGAFSMEEEGARRPPPAALSPAVDAEARAEVRQMLEAKSARREARGEAPLDIEAELEALLRPQVRHDEALREEVRQLVIARNARRARQGKEPLDVEAEVDRELRDLGGG
jgi:hypothetical protein